MKQLVIASNNKGKITEMMHLLQGVQVLSLQDMGFAEEIPEPYHTFEENAQAKAAAVHVFSNKNVFSDDSGICVPALNGAPGVDSAHYSGSRDDTRNLQQLLDNMHDLADRSAFYKAVICLIWEGETYFFEGICEGSIASEPQGNGGFGYDPIFIPNGHTQSFGELPLDVKNGISHRGKAMRLMLDFLKDRI